MDMKRPRELAILSMDDAAVRMVTDVNADHYADLALPRVEERWVEATDGKKIHCWVIYPPDFDPEKKYPLLTYCQGGPQGQIGQWFSYRWNFHLMAAQGYVVVAPNRRGLPGFGREWNDQISTDWGGQAMKDILSATDSMLAEPYVDEERVGAVGASFGGYTVYWLMGNGGERFSAMIAHCGVFNLESMYGSTEELFFVNHDLGGPYWKSQSIQDEYDRFSPHNYVGKWKTPLLVVHGQKDFRVPVTQGMEAFTAAQVQGVPSRFLYFPEEGHWVLSPQNGVLWHRVFFGWLAEHCGQ
jgi:dipeptidyl aminopeptidase/acylaminoacyl peptidase